MQQLAEAGYVFLTCPHVTQYLADAREIAARSSERFASKLAVRVGNELARNYGARARCFFIGP